MSTPVSSLTGYCTPAEFLIFRDFRTVVDLCSDENGRPLKSDFVDDSTVCGQIAIACLLAASGKLESAVLAGGRYTPDDLAALTGSQAQFIKGLVADLSIWEFYKRRPDITTPIPPEYEEAKAVINAIADGTAIFGLQENIDAGHLQLTVETPANVEARNLITLQAERLFGRRANRSVR